VRTSGAQVSDHLLERVRRPNLRIGVAEFESVWRAAEAAATSQADAGVTDRSAGAVTITCRWLAGAVVETRGHRRLRVVQWIRHRRSPA
jgi:hypothetical protein